MAQHDYNIANQGFPAFRTDLNNALSAIQTTNSGTSRPTGAVAGQLWLDTTTATSPTLKYYDGADDISLATIDHVGNTVNWLDSTVSITGLSTTATGTVLTLSDSATTSTVNLIIDNDKEIRFREATANGTNYVSLSAPASLSADLTFTLPATDGTSGQVLQTNGSGVLSFASAGLAWQTIVTGATLTAVAGRGYWIDTTSNACTVTLPASATNGDTIILVDYARKWGTNAVTINQNSLNFQGYSSPNPIYNTNGQSVTLVYSGATQGWIPTVDDEVTYEVPQSYTASYLIIAGGGGGGNAFGNGGQGGGGGAGGYLTSTTSLTPSTVYTITIGAGGAGGSNASNIGVDGTSGSNSSFTGLTTAIGGGGGGGTAVGITGGSGGGGGGGNNGASGTSGQGNAGGNSSGNSAGGGGGSTSAGTAGTNNDGGAGGSGTASSITGSSVTRAGGGGGGGYSTGGSAGSGGASAGVNNTSASNATANTGSGGGGAGNSGNQGQYAGGNGGSGVIILSVPTANYSGTTTGSPTVTTSGSNTIMQFNSSGSYTA